MHKDKTLSPAFLAMYEAYLLITKAGDNKSESESLTLRQCDAFTDDVPPFRLLTEQLDIVSNNI